MAAGLGKAGFTIVSGLALGIDAEAHAASLATGTIAVLGGGIDHLYPPQHERLYAEVAQKGLIISENAVRAYRPRAGFLRAATGSSPAAPAARLSWRRQNGPAR